MNKYLSPDYPSQTSAQQPNFKDLQLHAEVGIMRRGLTRYLFPKAPERSIARYTHVGIPLVRKLIMGTFGRIIMPSGFSNYRLHPSKPRIEAAARFAVGGSVFNEAVHTVMAAGGVYNVASHLWNSQNVTTSVTETVATAAIVGVQRYNRARMMVRINQELAEGNQLAPNYTNWLGLDGRAQANYWQTTDAAALEGEVVQVSALPAK